MLMVQPPSHPRPSPLPQAGEGANARSFGPIPAQDGAFSVATRLRERLAGFAGFLHANGYATGGADAVRIIEAAGHAGVLDREVLRWSLKALLCSRSDEWRRFDVLFDAWFLPPNRSAFFDSHDLAAAGKEIPPGPLAHDAEEPQGKARPHGGGDADETSARDAASRHESLASVDFSELARRDPTRDIEVLMRRFARRLHHLLLRREARLHLGRRLDLQGTIRRSVASGGTPLRLAWKDRRRVRPRLVLLLDVSRSMSGYSFFYLRLARALAAELADVHSFIFHTRITGVDEALRDPDPWRAQERMHLLAAGWGGGTRIGECLADFNRGAGARLVHSRTAVIVVSDGYDTGDPALLAASLAALRRRARRLVWLNPLLGQPGFSLEGRGMRAALPHLDLLAPGADLASIEHVLPSLIEALR